MSQNIFLCIGGIVRGNGRRMYTCVGLAALIEKSPPFIPQEQRDGAEMHKPQGWGTRNPKRTGKNACPTVLEFADRSGHRRAERVGAGTDEEKRKGQAQFGEGIFQTAPGDVEAVRQMNKKDRADHDDHDADRSGSKQHPSEDSEATGKLREPNQVANNKRRVHERGKAGRARATESSKEDGAAVIKKHERAGDAKHKKRKVMLRRAG
jgi:hypothetical protein